MSEKIYEFSVETRWTLFAKFTSDVTVYEDRVEIERTGRLDSIPEKVTVYFESISSITYTKDTDYMLSYIAFTGVSHSTAQSINGMNFGNVMAASSSANPWKDPYGIVFRMDMYEDGRIYYHRLNEAFEKYKRANVVKASPGMVINESSVDKLKKLKELRDLGIISELEYEEKRVKLLEEI